MMDVFPPPLARNNDGIPSCPIQLTEVTERMGRCIESFFLAQQLLAYEHSSQLVQDEDRPS